MINIVFVVNTKFTCETQWIEITHRNNVTFFLMFQTTYASISWIKNGVIDFGYFAIFRHEKVFIFYIH
jgi:hypothetical protein